MTVFLPAPDRLHPGLVVLDPEMEEEYLARPTNTTTAKIEGPGIAEIKPHTEKRIREAHGQLKHALRFDLRVKPEHRRWREALIITYRPAGRTTAEGTPVEVYAVRFVDEPGTGPMTYLKKRPWWNLGTINVPRTIGVNLGDLSVFGAAAERSIRTRFGQFLGQPPHNRVKAVTTAPDKSPNAPGPDVTWNEIAEMYAELARTTNDEFLAELADELATLG